MSNLRNRINIFMNESNPFRDWNTLGSEVGSTPKKGDINIEQLYQLLMNENVEENENRGKNYKFQEWSYVISVVTLAFHSLITVSTGKLAIFHPIGK